MRQHEKKTNTKTKKMREHLQRAILETLISVLIENLILWQLRVTLDNIHNSCGVCVNFSCWDFTLYDQTIFFLKTSWCITLIYLSHCLTAGAWATSIRGHWGNFLALWQRLHILHVAGIWVFHLSLFFQNYFQHQFRISYRIILREKELHLNIGVYNPSKVSTWW